MARNKTQAFILRIAPSEVDRLPEALENKQLIIRWAYAKGLLDEQLNWTEFREIIRSTYYPEEANLRRAGNAAGHMWRFIREMKVGDLVVVPHFADFHVAEVTGPAFYNEFKAEDDSAYRRPVIWLNETKPIPRSFARSALIARMKTQGTCADATDLRTEIEECVRVAGSGGSALV